MDCRLPRRDTDPMRRLARIIATLASHMEQIK